MKKRILALALAATTAFSMLGSGLSVSAAALNNGKWTDVESNDYMKPSYGDLYLEVKYGKENAVVDSRLVTKTSKPSDGASQDAGVTVVDLSDVDVAYTLDEILENYVEDDVVYLYNYLDTTLVGSDLEDAIAAIDDGDALALAKEINPSLNTGTGSVNNYAYLKLELKKTSSVKNTLRSEIEGAFKNLNTGLVSNTDYKDTDGAGFEALLTDIKGVTVGSVASSQLVAYIQAYNEVANSVEFLGADTESVQAMIDALASRGEDEFKVATDYARFMADLDDLQAKLDKAETPTAVASVKGEVETLSVKYTSSGADKDELKATLLSLFTDMTTSKLPSTYPTTSPETNKQVYVKADYAEEDWNTFASAYATAYEVYKRSSTKSFQTDVNNAVENLIAAIDGMSASSSAPNWLIVRLEELVAEASTKIETDYTTTSWKAFASALARAEEILDAGTAGVTSATNAADTLELAMKNLKVKTPSATEKNELKTVLNAARKTLKGLDKAANGAQYYALTAAITKAEGLYSNVETYTLKATTTKSMIADAIDALNSAIDFSEVVMGWSQLANGTWMYGTAEGYVTSDWAWIGSAWYYFDANGIMVTGWQQLDGAWYYFYNWGGMAKGWALVNGTWYYLNPNGGKMLANGWNWIDGKCYYFYSWGGMAANTTIDGYKVDASGAWVK